VYQLRRGTSVKKKAGQSSWQHRYSSTIVSMTLVLALRYVHTTVAVLSPFHIAVLALRYLQPVQMM